MLKKIMVPLLSCVIFSGFVGCGGDDLSEGSICSRWCKLFERCEPEQFSAFFGTVNQCRELCIEDWEEFKNDPDITDECYEAEKKLLNCVSKLSCSELDDYYEEPYANYPCAKYDRDVDLKCDWDDEWENGWDD